MAADITKLISQSSLSIYHPVPVNLFINNEQLEEILTKKLHGKSLDYPLRTRSKVVKQMVCEALGYPVPKSFKKSQPRFPGQNFDTYVQKANNLQIWNEEISASRRYVLIRVDENSRIIRVKVLSGETLAKYDSTGTLTQKFQAKSRSPVTHTQLVSSVDTERISAEFANGNLQRQFPNFMPVSALFDVLKSLVGTTIPSLGLDQERNRGGELHQVICNALGYNRFSDTGQFPDILEQLLEVKLQTSPTIDLGLISPDDKGQLLNFPEYRHCDVRYSVFYGTVHKNEVLLEAVIVSTGNDFFQFFQRFEGKVLNKKLQIPLPVSFFD